MEFSQSELARTINVSRQAISSLCKDGVLIKNKNNKIDSEEEVNADYIRAKGFNPKTLKQDHSVTKKILKESREKQFKKIKDSVSLKKDNKKKVKEEESDEESDNLEYFINTNDLSSGEEATRLLNSKFSEVLKDFGTRKKIKDYVDILYKLSQIEKNQMSSDAIRNELVEKKLIDSKVFQFLEVMNNQLLDYPQSVIEIEISKIKTNPKKAKSDIPKLHEKNISKILKECAKNIKRELKNISKEKELEVVE